MFAHHCSASWQRVNGRKRAGPIGQVSGVANRIDAVEGLAGSLSRDGKVPCLPREDSTGHNSVGGLTCQSAWRWTGHLFLTMVTTCSSAAALLALLLGLSIVVPSGSRGDQARMTGSPSRQSSPRAIACTQAIAQIGRSFRLSTLDFTNSGAVAVKGAGQELDCFLSRRI